MDSVRGAACHVKGLAQDVALGDCGRQFQVADADGACWVV
jgi:hypothetical protein